MNFFPACCARVCLQRLCHVVRPSTDFARAADVRRACLLTPGCVCVCVCVCVCGVRASVSVCAHMRAVHARKVCACDAHGRLCDRVTMTIMAVMAAMANATPVALFITAQQSPSCIALTEKNPLHLASHWGLDKSSSSACEYKLGSSSMVYSVRILVPITPSPTAPSGHIWCARLRCLSALRRPDGRRWRWSSVYHGVLCSPPSRSGAGKGRDFPFHRAVELGRDFSFHGGAEVGRAFPFMW